MPQQIINLGATGSGAGGDSARTAFEKAIANFAELYIAALPGTAAQKQAARDMFGLGTAATKAAQTGPTDTTAGALMAVGAFGLGAAALPVNTGGDLDAHLTSGFLSFNQPAVGGPGFSYGSLLTQTRIPSEATQIAASVTTDQLKWRRRAGPAWRAWLELFHTGNILGTVSQAGGVPTGAIIERGSNANGEFTRYADGTQICMVTSLRIPHAANADVSTGWTFPAPFAATAPIATPTLRAPVSSNIFTVGKLQAGSSATAATIRTQFSAAQDYLIDCVAIGRWY